MLQLRPNCECCNKDLPAESTEARICSFECTFCVSCVESVLGGQCPNCGGVCAAPASSCEQVEYVSGFYRACLSSSGLRENGLKLLSGGATDVHPFVNLGQPNA